MMAKINHGRIGYVPENMAKWSQETTPSGTVRWDQVASERVMEIGEKRSMQQMAGHSGIFLNDKLIV